MDAIESAIRNALAKGDASDRGYREKVYRSIFAALEKASSDAVPDEVADKRRKALAGKIREIETEYLRAIEPADRRVQPAPSVESAHRTSTGDQTSGVQRVEAASREPIGRHEAPTISAARDNDQSHDAVVPDEQRVFSLRRRPFSILLIVSLVIAAAGISAWWAYQSGVFLTATERDTGVPNPPKNLAEENFQPEPSIPPKLGEASAPQHDWITIFSPDDLAGAVATSGATAEAIDGGSVQLLQIRSGNKDAAVMFDVGTGILEQIAGRKAVFNIVASAQEGKPTEIAVRCNFGNLGDCSRRRFNIVATTSDNLFEIELPDAQPGAAGTIAIVSDVSGGGLVLNIHEIKVAISP